MSQFNKYIATLKQSGYHQAFPDYATHSIRLENVIIIVLIAGGEFFKLVLNLDKLPETNQVFPPVPKFPISSVSENPQKTRFAIVTGPYLNKDIVNLKHMLANAYLVSVLSHSPEIFNNCLQRLFEMVPGFRQNKKKLSELIQNHSEEWGFPLLCRDIDFNKMPNEKTDPDFHKTDYENILKNLNFKIDFHENGSASGNSRKLSVCALKEVDKLLKAKEKTPFSYLNKDLLDLVRNQNKTALSEISFRPLY